MVGTQNPARECCMKALIGASLIDGTGGPVINNAAVLVDGERIEAVGPRDAVALPNDAEVVDVSGLTLCRV